MNGLPERPATELAAPPRKTDLLKRARPLAVQSFGLSDAGRVRSSNEDDFLIAELTRVIRVQQSKVPQPQVQDSDIRAHLFIVADGMGGHQGGEAASVLAVEAVEEFLLNVFRRFFPLQGSEATEVLTELRQAVHQADHRIVEEAGRNPTLWGMGTTLTLAYCIGAHLFVAHVGDSRCYLLRGGRFTQVTQDHTPVAELVRQGHLTPEEAATHLLRHVVSNVIGGHNEVRVELHRLDLEGGDLVLLCTDGLTGMVPDDRIAAVLLAEQDLQKACERLVAEANDRGGRDNITVVIARFESFD